ncbi:hypothetical protein [Sodalis glossinidius]|uniref:hypothetical protein n=1 Tax=Sodalis glossinidius TaxID=63612 RepID=UPI0002EF2E90|nr:hypothetical protein [Sodalis glossinidius]
MRKTHEYVVKEQNRDAGKVFIITKMSAVAGEYLAEEMFRVMGQSRFYSIPPEVVQMGTAGLATVGLTALANADREAARLISQRLLSTVKIRIKHEGKVIERALDPDNDFEEISTLRALKDNVFRLNFDFLTVAAESTTPA